MSEALRKAISALRGWSAEAAGRSGLAESVSIVCNAAEAAMPQTKMVDVWRIDFAKPCHCPPGGSPGWYPDSETRSSREGADAVADSMRAKPREYACVSVTGPHQQEVPI